jgi:hypothetical protein
MHVSCMEEAVAVDREMRDVPVSFFGYSRKCVLVVWRCVVVGLTTFIVPKCLSSTTKVFRRIPSDAVEYRPLEYSAAPLIRRTDPLQ